MHTVANSLAVEIGQRVPWSLKDYTDLELANLFDSRGMFKRFGVPERYTVTDQIEKQNVAVGGLPCPPDISMRFWNSQKLLRPTRRGTIIAFTHWCRLLQHMGGGMDIKNSEMHWGYRGAPPASRVIEGTVYTGPEGRDKRKKRHTGGCHGTVSFMRTVLRAINVPVQRTPVFQRMGDGSLGEHATAYFMADGLYLSHGDDPYSSFIRYKPSFPVDEILMDHGRFLSWFSTPPATPIETNVARQTFEAAINNPPIYLINKRAQDMLKGVGREYGEVFAAMNPRYTLEALEKRSLWSRLDDAVAKLGGPEKAMAQFKESTAEYERIITVST
jgi:hypothetical protein